MNVLVTGLNGTVAPVLARHLDAQGHRVVGWDRARVPPDDPQAVRRYLGAVQPDAVCHLAMGPPAWAAALAGWCAEARRRFLYTSTVSVFGAAQRGPFGVDTDARPDDDYGRYKRACEHAVQAVHAEALVVRLGWQIGTAPGGNHLVTFLDATHRTHGAIDASTYWMPACSFLDDTAACLAALLADHPGGCYHLDANPGWSFFEIASRLNQALACGWTIVPTFTPVRDHRLADDRVPVTSLAERMGGERVDGPTGGRV